MASITRLELIGGRCTGVGAVYLRTALLAVKASKSAEGHHTMAAEQDEDSSLDIRLRTDDGCSHVMTVAPGENVHSRTISTLMGLDISRITIGGRKVGASRSFKDCGIEDGAILAVRVASKYYPKRVRDVLELLAREDGLQCVFFKFRQYAATHNRTARLMADSLDWWRTRSGIQEHRTLLRAAFKYITGVRYGRREIE